MTEKASSEDLMAYADGVLDEEQTVRIRKIANADPSIAAEIAIYKESRDRLAHAFDAPLNEPISERLAAIIDPKASDNIASFEVAKLHRTQVQRTFWKPAAAAAVALLTCAIGYQLGSQRAINAPFEGFTYAGLATTGSKLENALNNAIGEQIAPLGASGVFVPILSFATKDGRICREFETGQGASTAIGIACREKEGWRLELMTAAIKESASGGYKPAASLKDPSIEATLTRLGASRRLTNEEEACLADITWNFSSDCVSAE